MSFLYPTFLWALAGLSIPIIIHLFYFRRFKKVYFSNTRFLQEIKEETSSRNRLKNLLVLLMRCLAIACLVFAFAQPFIKENDEVNLGEKQVSVFIDNSFSMQGEQQNIPLLDIAKARGRDIIKAYAPSDRFQVLTHEFDGRYQRMLSQDEALASLDQIAISPEVHTLTQILNRQKQVLKQENRFSYLVSDFQESITDLSSYQDTSMEINLIPVQGLRARNIAIDSVWFASPVPVLNENNPLVVKLRNYGSEDAEGVKLSILIDDQEKPVGIMDVPAGNSVIDTVNLTITQTGNQTAEIKIQDYPVLFDDSYYISFEVDDKIQVLVIDDSHPNRYLDALFKGLDYLQISHQNLVQIQYQVFADQQLIILNDLRSISTGLGNELLNYLRAGGKVLIFPADDANLEEYNHFFSLAGSQSFASKSQNARSVAALNLSEFVFNDVFETSNRNISLPNPLVSYQFSAVSSPRPSETLMSFRDGGSFMQKYRIENGLLYVCSSPLDAEKSDLVKQAEIFVPMVYRMAISRPQAEPLAYTIGSDRFVELEHNGQPGEDISYKISGSSEFIPGVRNLGSKVVLDLSEQVKTAGFYEVKRGDQAVKTLAFNFNRLESDLTYTEEKQLSDLAESHGMHLINDEQQAGIGVAISRKDQGFVLWKYFLWAALAFLLAEALILRWMKS